MTENCRKFREIMNNYRAGKYGKCLHYDEILIAAGEPNLFDKLNEKELKYLHKKGEISSMMYSVALKDLNLLR